MDQRDYETIIECIQHGAPALAKHLIPSFNTVVTDANKCVMLQKQEIEKQKEAERKAAAVKAKDVVADEAKADKKK